MINEKAVKDYIKLNFPCAKEVHIKKLGSGVQGSGFLIEIKTAGQISSYVIKALNKEGLGHDYPSDRAGVFLLDLDEFSSLPRHVKAIDVLSELKDGSIKSIGGGREYYLLMEKCEGKDYFNDLVSFRHKKKLDAKDIIKIKSLTKYLAGIHSVKKESKTLYWRKLRDTVGHGECMMGVLDTYPDGSIRHEDASGIIKKSVDWIYRLKPLHKRLSQIHGDFHPGNIWFKKQGQGSRVKRLKNSELRTLASEREFVLLDRSRGPWGEPADDITALTINFIFFSIKFHGDVRGAYMEALRLFFREYISVSGDEDIIRVAAPFFAFRAVVVANPVFYPELKPDSRLKMLKFAHSVLSENFFDVDRANDYIGLLINTSAGHF